MTGPARIACVLAALGAPPAAAEVEALFPEVSQAEVLTDIVDGEDWLRLRLVMPRLDPRRADALTYEDVVPLFEAICRDTVLPYLDNHGLQPRRIVISLADRYVRFGETDPKATQFFEQFRPEGGACIWDEF